MPNTNSFEQHYKPEQLAKLWSLSATTIRRMFEKEPGVFVVDRPEKMHKRAYKTVRIPHSVALRVYQKYLSTGPSRIFNKR